MKGRGVPPRIRTQPVEALTHPPPETGTSPWSPKAPGEATPTARRTDEDGALPAHPLPSIIRVEHSKD
jgi:hypothetical protein